jgi:TetR/AcrR family transcriptional regulator, lmrAB and yxaGH operons repressor
VTESTRVRIEQAAADLLARHGYSGMGLKALSEAAQAPFGSVYHHFPGGKEDVVASSIRSTGNQVATLLSLLFGPEADTERALETLFDFMARRLRDNDWSLGCPVGTPALDGSAESAEVAAACRDSMQAWVVVLAEHLARTGVEPLRANEIAAVIVASYEGATLVARVQRDAAILTTTCSAMVELCRSARGASPPVSDHRDR